MRVDDNDGLEARYRVVRADPMHSLAEFWELSVAHADALRDDTPDEAEAVLAVAAGSLRERPHPADLTVSLEVLRQLAEVRGELGDRAGQREALAAERGLLEQAAAGTESPAWRDLDLRVAAADLAAERYERGFDQLLVSLDRAVVDPDDDWFARVVMELALATMTYAASRAVLSALEEAMSVARRDERDDQRDGERELSREVQLAAALAIAHLSRDGIEAAEIYEHRAHVLGLRLTRAPYLAVWASAAVALVLDDLDRAADTFATLSTDLAIHPDETDDRLRFEVLAGLGDARWRQGDADGARSVLTEAMAIGSFDRRRLARCHEILAELHRREHQLEAAFTHLQTTRVLEEGFRPRAAMLASERRNSARVVASTSSAVAIETGAEDGDRPSDELERRVESLEHLVDARTRQLERALIDLRDTPERTSVDSLTQLVDRRRLHEVLAEMARAGERCAVMAIDVDRFGRLNETLGHDVGDDLLVELARRLQRVARPRDTVARWGGDEFIVLMPGIRDLRTAAATAEILRQTVTVPITLGSGDVVPSLSIGVALATDDQHDGAILLRQADAALERAKDLGKGRVEVFGDELAHDARRRFDTEGLLRLALEQDLFELHFQPVHPNIGGEPLAAEALLRLQDPVTGTLLGPDSFLDVAEETGLAQPIGMWVLDAACRAAAEWQHIGVPFRLAVNVSASQLDAGFPAVIEEVLARHGLAPETLVIELTEHTLLEVDDAQVMGLSDIRSTGVRLALDDFGTAYSSLSHLRRIPVDVVKIDQSFVSGIGHSEQDEAIVRAVVDLSRAFDFQVIAEGVETAEQLDQVRRLGCHGAQGYLIGMPRPASVFAELLSTRQMFEALARTA